MNCEYATSYSGYLKRHVRAIHAQEMNFKYEQCDYAGSEAIKAVHDKI